MSQLKRLLSRLRPRRAPPPPPRYLTLTGPPDDPRLIVRRAYQALLEWAASLGLSRAPRQTPSAYADVLTRAAPDLREPIAIVTGAYVQARYAAAGPSLEAARRAEAAMAQLPKRTAADGPIKN